MLRRNKENKLPDRTNNIWNRYDFAMCGLGEESKLWAKIKHIKRCLRWSKQRIVCEYSDFDVRNMHGYLQKLLPDMPKTIFLCFVGLKYRKIGFRVQLPGSYS